MLNFKNAGMGRNHSRLPGGSWAEGPQEGGIFPNRSAFSAAAPNSVVQAGRGGDENQVTPFQHRVNPFDRSRLKGHKPAVLWFTGLSASGKSTIANEVEWQLNSLLQAHTVLLDGDNLRTGLTGDLGFSVVDRKENNRRVGQVAKLMTDAGIITLVALISPFRQDREKARALFGEVEFIEIYLKCSQSVCEARDPKGLYRLAKAGKIDQFTGITSPYEPPLNPQILLDTERTEMKECVAKVLGYLEAGNIFPTRYSQVGSAWR